MHRIPITSQISEVEREITERGRSYPGLIHKGKMRSAEAEECMERLRAVRETLLFCQRHEAAFRAFLAARSEPPAKIVVDPSPSATGGEDLHSYVLEGGKP